MNQQNNKSPNHRITEFFILLLSLSFLFSTNLFSQQNNVWYFGSNAGLDFNSGSPLAITNSASSTFEGSSTISDDKGNLLFYTDGVTVYNKKHSIMYNGDSLFGTSYSAQSVVIVPLPGNMDIYYIFTIRDWVTGGNGVNYSIVNMSESGGMGAVTKKNTFLYADARESLSTTRHSNGKDFWITFQDRITGFFYTYLLSNSGIATLPVVSKCSSISIGTSVNRFGSLKFSHSGNALAFALGGEGLDASSTTVEMYDFDNSTGLISNPRILATVATIPHAYSCEFSSNNQLLYVTAFDGNFINQFNLNAGTTAQIRNSLTNVGGFSVSAKSSLLLGSDRKIYVSLVGQSFLGVINYPDNIGITCVYVDNAVSLGKGQYCNLGLPNFCQNFFNPNNPMDSFLSNRSITDQNKDMVQLQIIYETEKREKEIGSLKQEKEIQQLRLDQQNILLNRRMTQLIALLACILLILTSSILFTAS